MASSVVITIKSEENQAYNQQLNQISSTKPKEEALALSRLFKEMASGKHRANFDVQTGSAAPVAASGTLTLSSVAADETCVIGGVTFTAKASPSGEVQFDQSGDDDADATSLASKINNHSTLSQVVTASVASNVVTVTAKQKGVIGNFITIVGDTGITASAATLASGTGGATEAAVNYDLGIS